MRPLPETARIAVDGYCGLVSANSILVPFDETIPATDDPINEEQIVGLTPYNARTRLQAAALRLSQVLRVHAEYDKRLK